MTARQLLRIAVALAVMALMWRVLDGGRAAALLASADPRWMTAALVALTGQTLLSAARWRMTAAALGQRIGWRRAVSEYYLGQIVNQAVPGGVAGDAGRAMRARHDGGLRRAGLAVALERAIGQVGLLAILAVGLALPQGPDLPPRIDSALWLAGTVVLAAAALAAIAARRALREVLAPSRLLRQAGLSLGAAALNVAAFALAARATGTVMTAPEAALLIPLILIAMILPVTVAGWGLREGAAAALFPLIGAPPEAGMAASICFGLVFLASTLPGLAVLLRDRAATPDRMRT